MSRNPGRPLSPHLTIWRWGPAMAVSILHRACGAGLAVGGGVIFVWWLLAAAMGPEAYATFLAVATSWFGYLVAIGLTWAFFQHLCNGLRHFVMDVGAGYELHANKMGAIAVMLVPLILTFAVWAKVLFDLAKGGE
ncbi:MAG: succinate dehydrogenase, cytochrome b556 subunit [Alphaproteobacteria bacterium]|nr:MAG: succinate dehydrogenase, cytochrome b556 subunit [Alphaproteobacteria bacterium]